MISSWNDTQTSHFTSYDQKRWIRIQDRVSQSPTRTGLRKTIQEMTDLWMQFSTRLTEERLTPGSLVGGGVFFLRDTHKCLSQRISIFDLRSVPSNPRVRPLQVIQSTFRVCNFLRKIANSTCKVQFKTGFGHHETRTGQLPGAVCCCCLHE